MQKTSAFEAAFFLWVRKEFQRYRTADLLDTYSSDRANFKIGLKIVV